MLEFLSPVLVGPCKMKSNAPVVAMHARKRQTAFALACAIMITVIVMVKETNGANILFTVLDPVSATSHLKAFDVMGQGLMRHGHRVTILTCASVGTKGFRNESYSRNLQYLPQDLDFSGFKTNLIKAFFKASLLEKFASHMKYTSAHMDACDSLFGKNDALLDELKSSRFDIIIADAFFGCDFLVGAYLDIPVVAVTSGSRYLFFHERLFGIPAPPSYVPIGVTAFTDRMSFPERVLNFLDQHVALRMLTWLTSRSLNAVKDKHGIAPDKDVTQLLAEAKLWLSATSWAIDFPRPITPNWVSIAGITDSPSKPLSKDLEEFIEGSGDNGFIVFSLGMQLANIPDPDVVESFARAFSELPQRVLWRYSGKLPRYLGNNTKLSEWLPQNDLLGHPKARLLIYHGGLHGVMEAIHHAVPMVIMPLFAEQASNGAKIETRGMGKVLRLDDVSYETVKATVDEVLENPVYAENVQRHSQMYTDRLSDPAETAVFWIEHVIKFGGSHLRTRAIELGFVQLHSIDVMVFLTGVVLLLLASVFLVCRLGVRRCFYSRKNSKKNKNKTD